jgi:L-threonylcarbamoyladenylate synthase
VNSLSKFKLHSAAQIIQSGGVIAYPTEGVFGLGCHPDAYEAVARILVMKQRDEQSGLILIATDLQQLDAWIDPDDQEQNALENDHKFVTWVVTARSGAAPWITGGRDTVAVRISQHPIAAALCRAACAPLVSTSANLHGRRPARSIWGVRRVFGKQVDYIVPGELTHPNRPSEIRVARTGAVLRAG